MLGLSLSFLCSGVFEAVERPYKLVYTWSVDSNPLGSERVTVHFKPKEAATTEVVIVHELISSQKLLEEHEGGWEGCLAGLTALVV